ncbi:MAG TPA: hypothetical protein PKI15_10090 [Candidatus Cloacimonadota bacterium]|nr:hypothetical protein [Candidatus Cloacimonadota bacterium]
MTEIAIRYRPVNFIPFTRNKKFFMPSRWGELTSCQMESISLATDPDADESKLISLFLGVSGVFVRKFSSYQKFCILRQLKYLNQVDICDKFIIQRVGRLKAPAKYLKNVTFGQFIYGDTYFLNYTEGRIKDLDRFIACFYTRGKFSEDDIEKNSDIISRESIQKREAIALNYRLIREWLARRYKNVFEQKKSNSKADRKNGWIGIFDAIVGDNITEVDRYADAPLSQVLRYLDRRVIEYYKNKKHGS